jgi:hypothetical protein
VPSGSTHEAGLKAAAAVYATGAIRAVLRARDRRATTDLEEQLGGQSVPAPAPLAVRAAPPGTGTGAHGTPERPTGGVPG